jgi:DNA-directed RNA polymerase subunit E'/Rpb7
MSNPFKDTILYTTVVLHPSQLNNNIYSNIKQNLMGLVGKCYKRYGYISKIYEILERDMGCIRAEDPTASVEYKVKFSCRLCHPIEKSQIVCKINKITPVFISLVRDPIYITVPLGNSGSFNENEFYWDAHRKQFIVRKTNEVLEANTFVKATILSKTFSDKDQTIFAIGHLDDIATDEDINKFYGDEYAPKDTPKEFDEVINDEKSENYDTSTSENTKTNKSHSKSKQ